ncbi:MAG: energy transducer TonB [Longimicrobiales bacterium]
MTAAAARPPLFTHLVASSPEHDRGSFGTTAVSVVIHGAVIVAIVALGARVRAPVATSEPAAIILPNVSLIEPQQRAAASSEPSGGSSRLVPQAPALPAPPEIAPSAIPQPGLEPRFGVHDFVGPTTTRLLNTRPGTDPGPGVSDRPGAWVAVTVLPRLLNREEVQRTMQRMYPSMLMQAGIGGTAVIWLRLDVDGRVMDTQVKQSSGHRALDQAAQEVGKRARFSPAYNRDQKVRVWVELPVVFSTRDR